MRELTPSQVDLVQSNTTKPIFLIELGFDGIEYLSTNGTQVVDMITYTGADIGLTSVSDWTSATLKLVPTSTRVSKIIEGTWKRGVAKIYILPCVNYPRIFEYDYVENDPEYGVQGLTTDTPILLLDGLIVSASFGGDVVTLQIEHKSLVGKWTPTLRITRDWAHHLPQAGTQLKWEGDIFTLEAREGFS